LKEGTKRGRAGNIFSGVFFGFSILASLTMIGLAFVFFFSSVEGPSMMNTINAQFHTVGDTDSVLVNRFGTPERGDMIVTRFHRQDGPNIAEDGRRFALYIKRVVGLQGEHIFFQRREFPELVNGQRRNFYEIQINGVPLDETDYLDSYWGMNLVYSSIYMQQANGGRNGTIPQRFFTHVERDGVSRYEILIPEGYIFYIGDNRGGSGHSPISDDSTRFGPQPMEYIVGTVTSIATDMTFFQFVWDRVVHGVTFRWLWG